MQFKIISIDSKPPSLEEEWGWWCVQNDTDDKSHWFIITIATITTTDLLLPFLTYFMS